MSCKLRHSPTRPAWASDAHTPSHCVGLRFCHSLAPLETQCCCPALLSKVWKYPWGDRGMSSGAEFLEHHIVHSTNHFHLGGGEGAVCFVNSVLWLIYSNINMLGEVHQNILWIYKYSYTNICHICIVITAFIGGKASLWGRSKVAEGFSHHTCHLASCVTFKDLLHLHYFRVSLICKDLTP